MKNKTGFTHNTKFLNLIYGFTNTTKSKNLVCGFTIIEILVVIAIIAVLTVVVFPAISQIRAKNRDAEKIADISTIQLALLNYNNQNNAYPNTLEELSPKFLPKDSLITPAGDSYTYVPLKVLGGTRCTYYNLGIGLELSSPLIDKGNVLSSTPEANDANGYEYCGDYTGPGINAMSDLIYSVHP